MFDQNVGDFYMNSLDLDSDLMQVEGVDYRGVGKIGVCDWSGHSHG